MRLERQNGVYGLLQGRGWCVLCNQDDSYPTKKDICTLCKHFSCLTAFWYHRAHLLLITPSQKVALSMLRLHHVQTGKRTSLKEHIHTLSHEADKENEQAV